MRREFGNATEGVPGVYCTPTSGEMGGRLCHEGVEHQWRGEGASAVPHKGVFQEFGCAQGVWYAAEGVLGMYR